MTYTSVRIIYNPNSTSGVAEKRASSLASSLKSKKIPKVYLHATTSAGDAELYAKKWAAKEKSPLLISVSGDGGYHEVINGALSGARSHKNYNPICAVLPAGNANDHRRATRKRPLVQGIGAEQVESIDILRVRIVRPDGSIWRRYAHSYIGLGVTAQVAHELNKVSLNRFIEIWITLQTLGKIRWFRVSEEGAKSKRYDSMIFANIHSMSKTVRVGEQTNLHDGRFWLSKVRHRSILSQFYMILKILIKGYPKPNNVGSYSAAILSDIKMQCDGEVYNLDAGSTILVTGELNRLRTIL